MLLPPAVDDAAEWLDPVRPQGGRGLFTEATSQQTWCMPWRFVSMNFWTKLPARDGWMISNFKRLPGIVMIAPW